MKYSEIPYFIYLSTLFIAVGIGWRRYKRLNFDLKLLLALFVVATIVEIISFILNRIADGNSWVSIIYMAIEYSTFGLIFSSWQKNAIVKYAIIISVPLYILIEIVGLFVTGYLPNLTFFIFSLASVFYVLFSSYTLIQLQKNDYGDIFRDHKFWITAGLLFYSAGTFVYYVIALYAYYNSNHYYSLYYMFLAVNGLSYIIYSKGFLCDIPRKT